MITAVDSSVLLDVVTDSTEHADASEEALRNARREGGLIINECVLAEIRPAFKTGEFEEFLADRPDVDGPCGSRCESYRLWPRESKYLLAMLLSQRYSRIRQRWRR